MKILLVAILLSSLPWLAAEPVRVALLAMDYVAQNLTDLALVELSADAEITFLERAEIAKIKNELKLSAATDFVPDPQLMQNTQVFAVLLKNDFIAYASQTGVRLVDLPTSNVDTLVKAIRAAVHKQQSFSANRLRKLSFMPMVIANLSEKQESLARQIETTLLRGLGNNDNTVLLERRHLLLLLNEPGAERKDLTRELFASAIVVKMTTVPEAKDSIRLKLQFHSPDGKSLLAEETNIFHDGKNIAEQCERYLTTLSLPKNDAADKSGEAHNFIYEAWFAISHSLQDDAIASAASACALDAAHEQELCRIAAKASHAIWQQWAKPRAERYAAALSNLTLAARLAAKNDFFPYELGLAVRAGAALPTQKDFEQLPAARQQELRTLIESILETRQRTLMELQRLANLPGEKWPDRLFALEARVEYLHELSRVAEIQWDYSYWERYIYPELTKYIAEANELLPELLKYHALPWGEKMKICSQKKYKKRRLPRFQQHLDLSVVDRDLANFFCFRPSQHNADNLASYRQTMELLSTAKILQLAIRGHYGLLRLKLGVSFLTELGQQQRQRDKNLDHAALSEFYEHLLEIFSTCELVGSPQTTSHNLTTVLYGDNTLELRLKIQELAMRRFAWYTPWHGDLIKGQQQWSLDECQMMYRKLTSYIEAYDNDSRIEQINNSGSKNASKYFKSLQEQLAKQHQNLVPSQQNITPVNPFELIISPLKDVEENTQPIVFGYADGIIYLGEYHYNYTRIVQIDTAANLSLSRRLPHQHQVPWQGRMIPGVVLSDYLAANTGGYVFLFPKDNTAPEILDFRQYFISRCHTMVGAGDRLFLSFDGEHGHPGTVLEYNVQNRTTKVLISTLDRSIKWPLQGQQEPYSVTRLICDPTHKRLIMLLPEQPTIPGRVTYNIRFWAYCWETEKWQSISRFLPITNDSSFNKFYLENAELWLLKEDGLGKINAKGDWQPALLLDERSRFSNKLPNYSPEFSAVGVDYSQCDGFVKKHRDRELHNLHFTHFANGILFSHNLLIAVPEMSIIPIVPFFPVTVVFNNRYVLGGHSYDCKNLRLGVLKDKALLLKLAQ